MLLFFMYFELKGRESNIYGKYRFLVEQVQFNLFKLFVKRRKTCIPTKCNYFRFIFIQILKTIILGLKSQMLQNSRLSLVIEDYLARQNVHIHKKITTASSLKIFKQHGLQ